MYVHKANMGIHLNVQDAQRGRKDSHGEKSSIKRGGKGSPRRDDAGGKRGARSGDERTSKLSHTTTAALLTR